MNIACNNNAPVFLMLELADNLRYVSAFVAISVKSISVEIPISKNPGVSVFPFVSRSEFPDKLRYGVARFVFRTRLVSVSEIPEFSWLPANEDPLEPAPNFIVPPVDAM